MPTFAIESPQTGQKYQVQFDREPSPADLEFAARQFDNEWWQQQGIEPGSAITQQTPLETVGNAIANVGPTLAGMVGGGMRYLDKAAEVVADVTGTERGGLFGDIAKQAEGIQAEGDVLRPLSPANPTAQTIGQGMAQGIGLIGTAAASVPALGARGMMAVPAVLGFGAGGGEGVQQGEAMGLSPMGQLAQGTAFGAAEAATEALGGIGGRILKPAGTVLGRMAGGIASEAIEEPAAGALQEAITNVSGLAVADPNRPGFTTTGFQLPGTAGYLERRGQEAIGGAAGGLVFAGVQPLMRAPGVGQPLSEAPASAPDAVPESTGDLTAEDVADLEPQPMPRREPILTGVPDRMARVRENALNTEPVMEGDVITDLRVPRSPEAIAESQRIENERLAQEAKLRAQEAKARGMPMVADSPTGSRDIVDWANENPIYLPPGFSAERKNAEYDALQRNPLPPYWRQFVASSKQGGNPDSIAQRAFDAGLIAEPTPDAYLQALQEGIAGRQQYRVQFAQRDKALAQEEKRVIDFEKSQGKLAKRKDTQQVTFENIVPGDEMTIDGEPAVVRNVEYNEDGYLTNVVIEDGKRFGLMQFDPQTRGGLLVDEFKPRSQPFAPAASQDQPQTITGSNVQRGTEMPVPPPTAAAGAGAGGRIVAAAVIRPDGSIATGRTHREADPAAPANRQARETPNFGFIVALPDGTQQFVSREQAATIAQANGQLIEGKTVERGRLHSDQVRMDKLPSPTSAAQGRVTRPSTTTTPRATAAQTAPAASVSGGQGVASGSGAGASQRVARAAGEVNLADVNAELQLAGGFTNLDVSGRTAGFLNTEILSEAEALVRRGVTSFVQWSQAMVRRFGEAIRAYLGDVWDNVRRNSELGAVMNPLARKDALRLKMTRSALTEAALNQSSWKDWYEEHQATLDEFFGDHAQLFQDILSVTSQAAAVKANVGLALKAFGQWHRGEAFTGFLPAVIQNLNRLRDQRQIQGQKISTYKRNNDGTVDEAVIDRHIARLLFGVVSPTKAQFAKAQKVLAEIAGRIGWTPRQVQAALWAHSIYLSGKTPESYGAYLKTLDARGTVTERIGELAFRGAEGDAANRGRGRYSPASTTAAENRGFTNLDTSGRTAGFLNTEILAEARQLIAAGFTTFANWSQAMVTRFGRGIREFLQGIWQQITSPQTNAAQNVRLGMPQGNAPVSIGAGGFVGGGQASNIPEGQDVTRSRFASPDEAENLYDIQATDTMRAESAAWLEANGIEAALAAMEANSPPEGLRIDHLPSLGAQVITRLAKLAESGTEAQRIQADALLDRAGQAWHGKASQEAGRTLQQRAMATDELRGIAPILATKQVLVERADRVVKERFEGGAEGAVQQVKDIDTKASTQAGEELAADLEAETAAKPNKGGNAIPPSERAKPAARSGRITSKHPNLKKLLDALRKKVAPGMTWAEIFMTLPAEQKARQREIYRRLMLDQRLKALNQGERLQLTNELDRAWQRERRKVFVRELEKITGLGKTPKDRDKVKAALPRLLRLMNLGMLNSETFRGAIAQEYGIQQIDAATGAELRKLGEQIQQAPEGLPRRKLEQQLMQRLQNLTGSTMAEVLESWWTASVLSGWRTQMDIALSLANGLEDVTLGSLVTALRTGNGRVAKDALFAMLSNLPTAMNEALDHLITGNRAAMRSYDAEVKAALEDGNKLFGNVGRQLLNKGGMAKLPGAFMEFVSRLMTALDHINSTSTYEGAKAMALARHPELYEKALTISPQDRQAARTQARLELTGGEAPTTRQQRVEETARMKEILDQRVPLEVQAQAREIGLESALQGEPTGVGAWIYRASNALNNVHRQSLSEYEKNRPDNLAGRAVLRALRITSPLVKVLTGTKFVRTVGHSINRSLSYAPGVGLIRFAEKGMQGSPAKADILLAKQLFGTAVGLALLMAFRDGEDDEQGIEGSWRGLTPQQKGQLLAEGKQPYSIWTRDAQGRIRTWNYQNWGIAGVLGTIGGMEDQRRYNSQGKDDLAILIDGILSGGFAWMDKAQLTGLKLLTGSDQPGSSSNPAQSWAGTLNRYASTTVGGVVPRLFKDVDMVISPQLRDTSEWWMKWAAQMPMLRETSSGKRVNIFGEDIVLDRTPTSRITQVGTLDPALRTLGRLNERDIWLPDPTQGVRMVKLADGTRRKMTPAEKDRYQRATGAAYRQFITEQGANLLRMDPELARETISKVTERLRNQAAYQAVRR